MKGQGPFFRGTLPLEYQRGYPKPPKTLSKRNETDRLELAPGGFFCIIKNNTK